MTILNEFEALKSVATDSSMAFVHIRDQLQMICNRWVSMRRY